MPVRIESHRSLASFIREALEEAAALHHLYVGTLPDAARKGEGENKEGWVCFYAEHVAHNLRPLCAALQSFKPVQAEEALPTAHVQARFQIPSNTYLGDLEQ